MLSEANGGGAMEKSSASEWYKPLKEVLENMKLMKEWSFKISQNR
jgi:hypothetical protein